jgi:hypothetical protein
MNGTLAQTDNEDQSLSLLGAATRADRVFKNWLRVVRPSHGFILAIFSVLLNYLTGSDTECDRTTVANPDHVENRPNTSFDRFHNFTSGPSSPSTGSVFGSLTAGIVFSALR